MLQQCSASVGVTLLLYVVRVCHTGPARHRARAGGHTVRVLCCAMLDCKRSPCADETRILELSYVHARPAARAAKSVPLDPLTSLHRQPVLKGMACAVGTSPRDTTAS